MRSAAAPTTSDCRHPLRFRRRLRSVDRVPLIHGATTTLTPWYLGSMSASSQPDWRPVVQSTAAGGLEPSSRRLIMAVRSHNTVSRIRRIDPYAIVDTQRRCTPRSADDRSPGLVVRALLSAS